MSNAPLNPTLAEDDVAAADVEYTACSTRQKGQAQEAAKEG
jgi:hypothetical protein